MEGLYTYIKTFQGYYLDDVGCGMSQQVNDRVCLIWEVLGPLVNLVLSVSYCGNHVHIWYHCEIKQIPDWDTLVYMIYKKKKKKKKRMEIGKVERGTKFSLSPLEKPSPWQGLEKKKTFLSLEFPLKKKYSAQPIFMIMFHSWWSEALEGKLSL